MECKKYNFIEEFEDINANDTEFLKKCHKINQDIESRQHTLVNFIEDLGVFLVDRSPHKRQYGVQILSTVMENLPEDFLTSVELEYIAAFYGDRLKDHSQVIPATLRGILAIVKSKHITGEAVDNLFTHMEINISCQQQQLCDRKIIYSIFEEFFNKHHKEMLATMNDKLLAVILEAMDGERDPRILLYLFEWLPKLLKVADLTNLKEQMFEILACYFPVDFKAPPQDSNAITRQELSDALCICLCASPTFADFCTPLALEKLDSSMHIAKIDSVKLIEQGCQTFKYDLVTACQIWEALKEEIFITKDAEVQAACWRALPALFRNMLSNVGPDYEDFLSCVVVSARKYLVPSVPNFYAATKMLLCVADVSERTCVYTMYEIIPILTNTYNLLVKTSEKIQVMQALTELVVVAKTKMACIDSNSTTIISAVATIFLDETSSDIVDIKANAYKALRKIVHALPNDVRVALFERFSRIVTMKTEDVVRTEILKCLEQCHICYPTDIVENVLPKVEFEGDAALTLYLEALCVLIPQPQSSDVVIDLFLPYLTHDELTTAAAAVECLSQLLKGDKISDIVQKTLTKKDIVHKMVMWTIRKSSWISNRENDVKLLNSVSFIIGYMIGCQTGEVQSQMYQKEMEYIKQCDPNKYVYMVLLSGLNLRLRSEVVPQYQILDEIITHLENETSCDYGEYATRLIANMLNKCTKDDILECYLQKLDKLVHTGLKKPKHVFITSKLISWVTKALAQRHHPDVSLWMDKMINLLTQYDETAKTFKVVLDDSFDELNETSYCTKRLLYRQRFFTLACQKLSALYDLNARTPYLMAFGYLWLNAPPQAVVLQLKSYTKLTLMSLEKCQEAEVLCILLHMLKLFIVQQCTAINEHMEEFLQRILKLTRFERSMKVRIAALQCLQQFSGKYPVYRLLPHKREVLDVLGECIDDRKRVVRQEAVLTRSIWFLLDMET